MIEETESRWLITDKGGEADFFDNVETIVRIDKVIFIVVNKAKDTKDGKDCYSVWLTFDQGVERRITLSQDQYEKLEGVLREQT